MSAIDHKAEAEAAASAGKYDIARYHAAMLQAEQTYYANLIAIATWNDAALTGKVRTSRTSSVSIEAEFARVDGWFATIREGLGL
jgi:hypothetical protein